MRIAVPVRVQDGQGVRVPAEWIALALIVTFGLVLRLYRFGGWNGNEAIMLGVSAESPRAIWAIVARDDPYHPPLFPIMLHFWRYLGTPELTIRLLPIILGTVSIWLVYRFVTYLLDGRTGLLAAFILAISPLHIWHSQEVRMYSSLFFFSLISLDALARLIREDRAFQWLIYVVAAVLSLYTNYGALLFLAAQNVAVAQLMAVKQGPRPWKWLLAQAAILAFFLPWVPTLLSLLRPAGPVPTTEALRIDSSVPATVAQLAFVLASFTSAFLPAGTPLLKAVIVIIFGAVFLAGVWSVRQKRVAALLLASAALVPLAMGFVLRSELGLLRARTVIPAIAGYYPILAAGLLALSPRKIGIGLLATLIVLNAYSFELMHRVPQKIIPWGEIADRIAAEMRTGDGVIFTDDELLLVFDLYYRSDHPLRAEVSRGANFERVRAFIDRHSGFFLVARKHQTEDVMSRIKGDIRSSHAFMGSVAYPGGVIVEHYRRL